MGRFDKFMVRDDIGTNRKMRRLSPAQRWAFVAGVLPLASKSPVRGALLITEGEPVTDQDIADESKTPLRDVRAMLGALREWEVIERDEQDVEWIADWDEYQAEPRLTAPDPNANRRKQLQRDPELREAIRARDGDECRYCGVTVRWTDRRGPGGGTYDHVNPLGPNSVDNLVVSCRRCNARKGNRSLEDAAAFGLSLQPSPDLAATKSRLNEVEVEEELTTPPGPPPPAVGAPFPKRVVGKRHRDIVKRREAVIAWMVEHLPGCPLGAEITVDDWAFQMRKRGVEPTLENVLATAEHNGVDLMEPLASRRHLRLTDGQAA